MEITYPLFFVTVCQKSSLSLTSVCYNCRWGYLTGVNQMTCSQGLIYCTIHSLGYERYPASELSSNPYPATSVLNESYPSQILNPSTERPWVFEFEDKMFEVFWSVNPWLLIAIIQLNFHLNVLVILAAVNLTNFKFLFTLYKL